MGQRVMGWWRTTLANRQEKGLEGDTTGRGKSRCKRRKPRGRRSLLCSRRRWKGRVAEIPLAVWVGQWQEGRGGKQCPIVVLRDLDFIVFVCGGGAFGRLQSENCQSLIHIKTKSLQLLSGAWTSGGEWEVTELLKWIKGREEVVSAVTAKGETVPRIWSRKTVGAKVDQRGLWKPNPRWCLNFGLNN